MLSDLIAELQPVLLAPSAATAGERFFATMQELGASYCQVRLYQRPDAPLTSNNHFAAGGRVFVEAPAAWAASEACRYICFEQNPLLEPVRENRTAYAFSDYAPHGDRDFGRYWDAMAEARIGDALCATSYGANGVIASLHLGFVDRDLAERRFAVQMAGLMLTERLLGFAPPVKRGDHPLTTRERDALAYVAEGKTDWEIGTIMGVAEATARFHVDNGRKKLRAVNRAHAVAKLAARRLI